MVRLILRSINGFFASIVMCFLLIAMASGLMTSDFGIILLQLLHMLIFFGLPFMNFKKLGMQEQKTVRNGDIKEDLTKGFKVGFFCAGILEISVLLLVFMRLGILPDQIYLYKILNPQFTGIIRFMIPEPSATLVEWKYIFFLSILPLLYPLAMGVGYVTGYRDRSWL